MRTIFIAILLFVTSLTAFAQAPAFEVASIKLVDPTGRIRNAIEVFPGGRVVLSGQTLRALVAIAFNHPDVQNASGAAWIENDRYDVQAKAPENSGITNFNHSLFGIEDPRLREMLQALLADRFQLRVHRDTKTGDVWQLARGNKALGFNPAQIPEGRDPASLYSNIGYAGGRWVILATTMPQLAAFASRSVVRAPVVDLTKMNGTFDYRQTEPDQDANYSDPTDAFLRMLDTVGLELKRSRGAVETLVIDGAVRPTSN